MLAVFSSVTIDIIDIIDIHCCFVLEPCGVSLSTSELEDLSQSKLWRDNSEWSNEVQEIRRELVHGKRLSHSEIFLRLKTLKLVDKKVHHT